MPTRNYEYDCGRFRNVRGISYGTIDINDSYFNSHFSFQQLQHSYYTDSYSTHCRINPEPSAAAALEHFDRDTYAHLAGVGSVRRQSVRFDTQIHTPCFTSDRRRSSYIRTSRVGQILISSKKAEKSEKHRCRRLFQDYPCKDCRRSDRLERQRCAVETGRLVMGLRPTPGEHQRGTGGNRYRGDSWYEEFERDVVRRRVLKVRFEEDS